jgi:hypothetical protein
VAIGVVAMVFVINGAWAQTLVRQSLKDAWVATSQRLFEADYGADPSALVAKNPDDVARNFQALVFETPALGGSGAAVRGLIAVDGTKVWRFENGSNEIPPVLLFDAANAPSSLKSVTAAAVTDTGTVLISGYSKPKRVFEIWEITETANPLVPLVQARATSTPQLTDAVYVRGEDVVAGSRLAGGGLLATAGRQVLFFPASQGFLTTVVLFDARALGVKGNTQLLSLDLIRETDTLMIATSERTLLTAGVTPSIVTTFASIPAIAGRNCASLKPQRLVVRNARGGSEATSIVTDICGQVLRYDFSGTGSQGNVPTTTLTGDAGFVALAVGEGNEITCPPNELCSLAEGFDANIHSQSDSELLVLQFDNLCDLRVDDDICTIGATDDEDNLLFNTLLPQSIQEALAANGVSITIPPYMFGAGSGGRFGALIVQADESAATAGATVELYIDELLPFELGVRTDFPRTTATLDLLNQDVAAYAPDDPDLPTVRDFEATPVTIGMRNPMLGGLRGFSVVLYGLQHDTNPPGPRATGSGGLPPGTVVNGSVPTCNLVQGAQQFIAIDDEPRYFINLAACLFADEEELLRSVIPNGAFLASGARESLLASLENTKDKVIKALNASGPNTGSETFQAVLSQLDHFDAAVLATAFDPELVVYKNELGVRSKAFRFVLMSRAYPSLPPSGF